jgi:putative hydrolase of the HAD superfamily
MTTLILDLGNVIAFFDHRAACRQLAALASTGADESRVYGAIFKTPLEEDFDCGRISPEQFVGALRTTIASTAPDEAIARAWCDIFRLNDDVASLLPAIQLSPLRLVLASSTNALHFQWVTSRFPTAFEAFDEFVVSFEVGARKPDQAFFNEVLTAAAAPAHECMYIDDRPEYVHAAREMGMSGAVYGPGVRLAKALEDVGIRLG